MTDNNVNKYIPETKTEFVLNQEQQAPQEQIEKQKSATEKIVEAVAPVGSTIKEEIAPTVEASDNGESKSITCEEQEEGAKNIVGGVSAATGGVLSIPLKILGKAEEGVGQVSGNENIKKVGEINSEGASKPKEWTKELFK